MNRIVLSICVPTFNRVAYLRELLPGLLAQAGKVEGVEVCVSDNCSSDGTAEYLHSCSNEALRCWCNPENIGGDRNFLKCIAEAKGEYVWLVGDDDLVADDAVASVLAIIEAERPDLIISMGERGSDKVFADYGQFLSSCGRSSALAHTLISDNVFRRDQFDLRYAEGKLYTQYAHMFGLMRNISGKVITVGGLVSARPVRAEFSKYPNLLCVKQALYLWYLADRFNQPRFRWLAIFNALTLPMELASRIKRFLFKCAS